MWAFPTSNPKEVSDQITAARLLLVPADLLLLRADAAGVEELSRCLCASPPSSWPPPLMDQSELQWTCRRLLEDPGLSGWLFWYWLTLDPRALIGLGGFQGKPDASGAVEIGYSVLPAAQGKGYATEAVQSLVRWAFLRREVKTIRAETHPHVTASIRVLEKNGFRPAGAGKAPDLIRFERRRSNAS